MSTDFEYGKGSLEKKKLAEEENNITLDFTK
jgi:hypothetical protein